MFAIGVQEGVIGEVGLGSVLRRWLGGFLGILRSSLGMILGGLRRREGTGEDLNSSIRSVSGTGSMSARGERHAGKRCRSGALEVRAFLQRRDER